MADPDREHLAQLRELGNTVGSTDHDELATETVDSLTAFVGEVEDDLDGQHTIVGARKLLAFWDAFIQTKLDIATDEFETVGEETIDRFEQAFDEDVIGIDLYQALETLAIVAEMPDEELDEDRLSQWGARVHALTEEFVSHLRSHVQ